MTSINRLPVVDTHHHLWDLSANYYPWLTDRITTRVCGEYSAIRKNYLLEDFKEHSDLQFILCHTGQPSERDEESLNIWRTGMRALAEFPNVYVKISGLGMFDNNWTVDTIRPFILHAIEVFSVERCMFGSNFPVDGMMTSYSRLWSAYSEITSSFSVNERYALFCGNAERIYRI